MKCEIAGLSCLSNCNTHYYSIYKPLHHCIGTYSLFDLQISCSKCGNGLGHEFLGDGPKKGMNRYWIFSSSLKFQEFDGNYFFILLKKIIFFFFECLYITCIIIEIDYTYVTKMRLSFSFREAGLNSSSLNNSPYDLIADSIRRIINKRWENVSLSERMMLWNISL